MHVCPTGVDIRNGPNLGCIQCGLCIDACDAIMAKTGRPARLIAYDTDINIHRRQEGKAPLYKIVRARTALYVAIIAIVAGVMLYTLATRRSEGITVIHDRNPIYVRLADGSIRNAFTVHILNKSLETRLFLLTVDGLPGVDVQAGGRHRDQRQSADRGRPRPDPRIARAGHDTVAVAAGGLDPADLHHHRCQGRIEGQHRRSFPRAMIMSTSNREFRRGPPGNRGS